MAFPFLASAQRFARRGTASALFALATLATLTPHTAFALTTADVAPLAADDFDAKSAAIDKLIANHDKESLTVLKALSEDAVLATDSGAVLLQDGDTLHDAVTGKPVEASDAQPVTLNNLLRSKVSGALSGLQLDSADKTTREEAINALLKNPDPSIKPLVDAARAKETDPALKKRLDTLWAMTALHDADATKRLEAVQLVAARHDLDMNELPRPLVAKKPDGTLAAADASVWAGAQSGIDELFQRFAPGAFDWYPLLAVPASFVAAALVGIVIERLVLKHLYGRPLETLLTTFGISLILIQATRMLFGAQNVQVVNPSWMSGGVTVLPNLILPYNRLVILAFALFVVGIAWAVLTKTRL
ncbi:MAG: urea ABC transporter permease subunit UrtB, partial [Burkholderia sp.]|nr:urea ABC transporter permease subunit UrtB [Burkholderia sp.]